MELDFRHVKDTESYTSIPPGTYRVRIIETRPGVTRDDSPMWGLRLQVVDGEYGGRLAAWDNLVFSERGLPRAKLVLEALGFDVSGTLELERGQLLGLEARVDLVHETYDNARTGRREERNAVKYAGWSPPEDLPGEPTPVSLGGLVAESEPDPF